MKKDIITMSRKELRRLPIIHKVMEKRLTQVKAAEMLDLSDRQIRRIVDRIKPGGDSAIVHGNRDKESPFKFPVQYKDKVMDSSDHDWLEGRGPRLVFIGYIDDASGRIFGRFYEYEGTFSAMDSFREYISIYGIPFSFYVDRHSAYKTTRQPNLDEDLQGEFAKTQFARSLGKLDVKIIFARSPQAKERIERLFETLQDRLVKELRLANVSTSDKANAFLEAYLPKYNARFEVKPFKKTNLRRPSPKHLNLNEIFCVKERRSIGNDYSFHWKNRHFIIPNPSLTMKKQRICVMESFDGIISAKLNGKLLDILEVTQKDIIAIERVQKDTRRFLKSKKVCYRPPMNHPWKRFSLKERDYAYA